MVDWLGRHLENLELWVGACLLGPGVSKVDWPNQVWLYRPRKVRSLIHESNSGVWSTLCGGRRMWGAPSERHCKSHGWYYKTSLRSVLCQHAVFEDREETKIVQNPRAYTEGKSSEFFQVTKPKRKLGIFLSPRTYGKVRNFSTCSIVLICWYVRKLFVKCIGYFGGIGDYLVVIIEKGDFERWFGLW